MGKKKKGVQNLKWATAHLSRRQGAGGTRRRHWAVEALGARAGCSRRDFQRAGPGRSS